MKFKIIILFSVGLLLVGIGCMVLFTDFFSSSSTVNENISFGEEFILNMCDEEELCDVASPIYYYNLDYKGVNQDYKDIVDEINIDNENLYKIAIDSKLNGKSCSDYNTSLNYGLFHINDSIIYSDEKIISILVDTKEFDLCSGTTENLEIDSYIYSIEKDEVISDDELLDIYGISEEDLYNSIEKNINNMNANSGVQYFLDEYFDEEIGYKYYHIDQEGNFSFYWFNKINNVYVNSTIK